MMKALSPSIPQGAVVSVVDDDASVRRGLVRLLKSADLQTEMFSSADAYLRRDDYDGPSCVVLDLLMPGLNGLELQHAIGRRETKIVFLSGHGDVPTCAEAMKSGAIDFLTKPVDADVLLRAVSLALVRSSEVRKTRIERCSARARLDSLTPREFEVMQRVVGGMLNKQIADELGAAEKTIKIHRARVMEKMGVTSVADLVRISQTAGVAPAVPPP